jgi:hypothetical protein
MSKRLSPNVRGSWYRGIGTQKSQDNRRKKVWKNAKIDLTKVRYSGTIRSERRYKMSDAYDKDLVRCPKCSGYIPSNENPGAYPGAISRVDNKTEICSACGVAEALGDFRLANADKVVVWKSEITLDLLLGVPDDKIAELVEALDEAVAQTFQDVVG